MSHVLAHNWASTRENLASGGFQTTQVQTRLRNHADLSAPLLFAFWKEPNVNFLQAKFQFSS